MVIFHCYVISPEGNGIYNPNLKRLGGTTITGHNVVTPPTSPSAPQERIFVDVEEQKSLEETDRRNPVWLSVEL